MWIFVTNVYWPFMQPYRLEMGLKLETKKGANLYQFWDEKITDAVNLMLAKQDEPVLINLASEIDCNLYSRDHT